MARDRSRHCHAQASNPGSCDHKKRFYADAVPRTKLVQIEVSESLYTLEPHKDGTVKLTWIQLSDPAGALPEALVNSMIVTSPLSTLKDLREMVKKTGSSPIIVGSSPFKASREKL